ncbi:uncharacterized protein LY89DRAFT_691994 [Mollisia scopiformis]|uniref:Uncharacterized protein n=1 Tax=Mollisia scopiformis TaxID=149040 RepID=A0A132B4B1_MOLSC|nr:uncharacterized protein LY89DRAFT_691994 [Mollisia scopiformis]KUJ07226.1 hypothetical protein LY89DRAFT_691994 [Mollisia scopiformis]
MCGVLITWCIGRNNNGPIGTDNQVRGEAINTRVVKSNPVNPSPDTKSKSKGEGDGIAQPERAVYPKQEGNSHEEDSRVKVGTEDPDTSLHSNEPKKSSHVCDAFSDFTNSLVIRAGH